MDEAEDDLLSGFGQVADGRDREPEAIILLFLSLLVLLLLLLFILLSLSSL